MLQSKQLKILQLLSDLDDEVERMSDGPFEYLFHYKRYLEVREQLDDLVVKSFYRSYE